MVLMLRFIVIAIISIVIGGLISAAYYYHCLQPNMDQSISSANTHQDATPKASTPAIGDEVWQRVKVKVDYDVIVDPEVLSIAREFIGAQLPLPASLTRESVVDWLNTDIAVLKVVIGLVNDNDKPIYYVTNAFCEVLFNTAVRHDGFKPIIWRVNSPIAVPKILAEEGAVFPLAVACALDLRYEKVLPKTSTTSEYYYILTKPFGGTIKAEVVICIKPLSNQCKTVEAGAKVEIQ